MSTKAEVACTEWPESAVAAAARAWGKEVTSHTMLFGGYSGSNYKLTHPDGSCSVLKVLAQKSASDRQYAWILCSEAAASLAMNVHRAFAFNMILNGYDMEAAEGQAAVLHHLRLQGVTAACAALARESADGPPRLAASMEDGTPCLLLSWVEGVAADKAIAAQSAPLEAVLGAVGRGLAAINSVSAVQGQAGGTASALRGFMDGGACDVRKHLNGEYKASLDSCEAVRGHPFLAFYEAQAEALELAMQTAQLPHGVLHGDPFLDNVLVDPSSGALCGFVDFEDACVGPVLFDIACCASAACFRADSALDVRRLRALMEGYASRRALCAAAQAQICERARRRLTFEIDAFLPFMKLTLLCNCAWRFKQFNVDHREIVECRDAHQELQDRILALEDDVAMAAVETVLKKLPSTMAE